MAGFTVSSVPMSVARDSPVEEATACERSQECEGSTWLLESWCEAGGLRNGGKREVSECQATNCALLCLARSLHLLTERTQMASKVAFFLFVICFILFIRLL